MECFRVIQRDGGLGHLTFAEAVAVMDPRLFVTIRQRQCWRALRNGRTRGDVPLIGDVPDHVPSTSMTDLFTGLFESGVTAADLHESTSAQARLMDLFEVFTTEQRNAVKTLLLAACYRERGEPIPDAIKTRLTRHRQRTGFRLSLFA